MSNLDDVCHCYHLKLISKRIVTWEMIALALGLSDADIKTIQHNYPYDYESQKYQMLCKWKYINGQNATYKALADIFNNSEQVYLAEALLDIVNVAVSSFISEALKRFENTLKSQYRQGINFNQCTWPPLLSETYFNLALIKKQSVKLNKIDDGYTRSTIHHCPDDVFKEKEPIELENIFKFEKSERKCILIEAGPGLGETRLSFKICKDWADGHLLQNYEVVVLVQLRLPEFQKAKEIVDLLLMIEDGQLRQNVAKELCDNNGDRVCFIVEGFDELPQDLQRNSIFTRLSEKLPQAMIIYTSRPLAASHLRSRYQLISKRIEIIGFKFEQVQELVEETLVKLSKEEQGNAVQVTHFTTEDILAIV